MGASSKPFSYKLFGISSGIWSTLKEDDSVEVAWEQEIIWREQV
jgi:hypothetical protein